MYSRVHLRFRTVSLWSSDIERIMVNMNYTRSWEGVISSCHVIRFSFMRKRFSRESSERVKEIKRG